MLVGEGFRLVPFREVADLYVIDTCTVTAEADKKSRKAASRAHAKNPDAVVAVTGCAATKDAAQFEKAAPGALVLNNAQKFELPARALERLKSIESWAQAYADLRAQTGSEPIPTPTRERAVLKIQDGCNHRCSYCIIPRMRGESRIKSHGELLAEARIMAAEGARELVVTGVSMGDFSIMNDAPRDDRNAPLNQLLRAVAAVEGLHRVRTSSLDPADVDENWLQCVAHTPGVMPHIHLAMQSGCSATLRRMRRRYSKETYLKWARRWREIRPDAGLTTDVIVGFPGETDEEWRETLETCRLAQFSDIHVFSLFGAPADFRRRSYRSAGRIGGARRAKTPRRRIDRIGRADERQFRRAVRRPDGRIVSRRGARRRNQRFNTVLSQGARKGSHVARVNESEGRRIVGVSRAEMGKRRVVGKFDRMNRIFRMGQDKFDELNSR